MTGIALGNLSIEAAEKRSGVTWPNELKTYMEDRRQEKESEVHHGKWPCFDIPFVMVCRKQFKEN